MSEEPSRRVVVKLRPDAAVPPALVDSVGDSDRAPWSALRLIHPRVSVSRYFTSVDEWAVPAPDEPAQPLPGSERGARYFAVDVSPQVDSSMLLNQIRELAPVDTAYVESPAVEPPTRVDPGNDPLSAAQGYLDAAPVGINARWAWALASGSGAEFIDIEQGWFLNHKDLPHIATPPLMGLNREFKSHGTSVLGQLVGVDNDEGIIGIAPDARGAVVSEWRAPLTRKVGDAVLYAASLMRRGHVLLIEAQNKTRTASPTLVPAEVEDAVFAAIWFATRRRGIIVVEPASNGGTNLDQYEDDRRGRILNRQAPEFADSGAVMVAAATALRRRLGTSSYGSRVDCFAWGENITTAEGTVAYTSTFGQTSGASAIVAGAALLLQSCRAAAGLDPYDPTRMRELLAGGMNTPSTPADDRIGVMPNLRAILESEGQFAAASARIHMSARPEAI